MKNFNPSFSSGMFRVSAIIMACLSLFFTKTSYSQDLPASGTAITSDASYIVQAGVTSITVHCWGGGGGGGGSVGVNTGFAASGGGGGGAYSTTTINVTAGQSYTATIGTGGTAGSSAGGNGGNGGTSSFSGTGGSCTAAGGNGGAGRAFAGNGAGGTGGSSGTGFMYAGGSGGTGNQNTPRTGGGGAGASNSANGNAANNENGGGTTAGSPAGLPWQGGAGGDGWNQAVGPGDPGIAPGGGGGGGLGPQSAGTNYAGGAGARGQIVLVYTTGPTCTNPSIDTEPSDEAVCEGSSASLTVAASGTGLTYQWYIGSTPLTDGPSVSGSGSAVLTIDPVAAGDVANNYNVVISGDCGSPVTSVNAGISLLDPAPDQPSGFTTTPTLVCTGDAGVAFGVDPVAGATSYNWTYTGSGVTINGSGNAVTLDFSSNAVSGTLSVTAENSCGISAAEDLAVTVNVSPAVTLTAFADVCANDALFTLTGGSPAGGSYFVDGTPATDFDPAVSGGGNYTIMYMYDDPNGCSASATQNLLVDLCTGLQDVIHNNISIYPNPAADYVILSFPQEISGYCSVTVVDAQGKTTDVLQTGDHITEGGLVLISTLNYNNGLYKLQVEADGMRWSRTLAILR